MDWERLERKNYLMLVWLWELCARVVALFLIISILVQQSFVNDNDRLLQDNPKAWWDTDLIAQIVAEYVKKWKIDAIITFDDGGVSGHLNHRAVAAGVRYFLSHFF